MIYRKVTAESLPQVFSAILRMDLGTKKLIAKELEKVLTKLREAEAFGEDGKDDPRG